MSQLANLLDQAEADNKASDDRATHEVRGQRIRELEQLLSECLDYPAGVNCCHLEQRIAKALGRKIR